MNIGKLDRCIKIWEPVYDTDSAGQKKVIDYTLFAEPWASKREVRTKELFQGSQLVAIGDVVWETRYFTGIRPDMILENEGQLFEIHGEPIEIGRREGWQIIAQKKDDNVLINA